MIQSFFHRVNGITIKSTILNIIPLIFVFILSLIPRIHDLSTGLTTDERLWLTRSPIFFEALLDQNWTQTYQAPHPGVTTMWVSGFSMHLFRTMQMGFGDVLMSGRLPIALITSGAILIVYLIIARIFNKKIAFLSAVLMALDPFFIANSRFIHLDAMLTIFMLLSVLTFFAYLNEPHKKYLLMVTGFFAGLALLTKLPALFLILFIPFIMLVWCLWKQYTSSGNLYPVNSSVLRKMMSVTLFIGCVCCVTYCILWPAMWVAPIETILKMVTDPGCGLFRATLDPHGSGFFMGEVSNGDYGVLFYPIVILMRSSPLALLFSFVCLGFIVYRASNNKFTTQEILLTFLVLYIVLFTVQMTIGKKSFDRYLLPIFPIVDILAAAGIYHTLRVLYSKLQRSLEGNRRRLYSYNNMMFGFAVIACIIIQSCLLIPIAPYYNSYFNPVAIGSPTHATEILLVGWGEGNDLAAEYLNNKPDPENLTVAYQYNGFAQYFKGKSVRMESASSADYIVFYVSMVQRHNFWELWNQFKNKEPEKIININGINYCWIYNTTSSNFSDQ